ncbi:hypothetical protein V7x_45920 [Crateriforma conspicua]|uniref:Uncharacterized protein n=1 Tax=Crateriforma conspicua TaxID=2527996 RepID=A0A5C6FQT6_9PLAN|nr:hypothetical protein V7x_45920 [Crateriforma conspicua]
MKRKKRSGWEALVDLAGCGKSAKRGDNIPSSVWGADVAGTSPNTQKRQIAFIRFGAVLRFDANRYPETTCFPDQP